MNHLRMRCRRSPSQDSSAGIEGSAKAAFRNSNLRSRPPTSHQHLTSLGLGLYGDRDTDGGNSAQIRRRQTSVRGSLHVHKAAWHSPSRALEYDASARRFLLRGSYTSRESPDCRTRKLGIASLMLPPCRRVSGKLWRGNIVRRLETVAPMYGAHSGGFLESTNRHARLTGWVPNYFARFEFQLITTVFGTVVVAAAGAMIRNWPLGATS